MTIKSQPQASKKAKTKTAPAVTEAPRKPQRPRNPNRSRAARMEMAIDDDRVVPLSAPEGVTKISPLEASKQYLLHMRSAWNASHPDAPLENQSVLITVPASFDPGARELTQRAAKLAGYGDVIVMDASEYQEWLADHKKPTTSQNQQQ